MASIKIVQRKQPLKDGTYPIVLQIIKNRKRKIISLGWSCSKDEFSGSEFTKKYQGFRSRNQALLSLKLKAEKILDEFITSNKDFTLDQFEKKFRGKENNQTSSVQTFFKTIIDELERSNRLGNARAYKEAMRSFKVFLSDDISFSELTPGVLNKYEVFMRERGNNNGGIAFKMRHLRALYNMAIARGKAKQNEYPFRQYKISKLKHQPVKRALTNEEFTAFKNLNLKQYPHLRNTYNYFMFSFYTRGMNFIDMMQLRWSNINGDKLVYKRSKTGKNFNIRVLPETRLIIEQYRNVNTSTKYIFPLLLKENMTSNQIENRKKKTLKKFNRELKEIAKICGISKNITSYVSRHSYGTLMKQKGVPIEVISESMGHSNVEITQAYLKQFDDKYIDDANDILSNI